MFFNINIFALHQKDKTEVAFHQSLNKTSIMNRRIVLEVLFVHVNSGITFITLVTFTASDHMTSLGRADEELALCHLMRSGK